MCQILYAFHVFHENYRAAAAATYLLSHRLATEQRRDSELGLADHIRIIDLQVDQRQDIIKMFIPFFSQRNALSSTLNALRLLTVASNTFLEVPKGAFTLLHWYNNKKSYMHARLDPHAVDAKEVEVVTLQDIQRDFALVNARLTLMEAATTETIALSTGHDHVRMSRHNSILTSNSAKHGFVRCRCAWVARCCTQVP